MTARPGNDFHNKISLTKRGFNRDCWVRYFTPKRLKKKVNLLILKGQEIVFIAKYLLWRRPGNDFHNKMSLKKKLGNIFYHEMCEMYLTYSKLFNSKEIVFFQFSYCCIKSGRNVGGMHFNDWQWWSTPRNLKNN